MIQHTFLKGVLYDKHLEIDATHFESRDASKPSEKKETPSKKHVRKAKEEYATWVIEQGEIDANRTTYEEEIEHQLDAPIAKHWGIKKNSDGKNTFRYGFKGHLAVSSKMQSIVSRLMTAGNLHDSKTAIPLLKKVESLIPVHFITVLFVADYVCEPIDR